jgi:hypothetical protein
MRIIVQNELKLNHQQYKKDVKAKKILTTLQFDVNIDL